MNYIEVQDYINKDNVKEYFKNIPEIKLKGKNLTTTSEHELALIANAATDNAKKLKLTSMGFVGKGGRFWKPNDFFIQKIFKVTEGNRTRRLNMQSSEDLEVFQILRKVFKSFNTTSQKNGMNKFRKNANMKEIFNYSREMFDKFNQPKDLFISNLAKEISTKNIEIKPEDISIEPVQTSDERLISYIHEFSKNMLNNKNISHIMDQNETVLNTSHNYAIQQILEVVPRVSKEAKNKAYNWFKTNGVKYFDEIQKGIATQNEDYKLNYNEEIVKWTQKSQAEINRLPNGARSYITYLYLLRLGKRYHLPPMDLLDQNMLLEYKKLWHEKYYSNDSDLWIKRDDSRMNKSYKKVTGQDLNEDC